MGPGELARPPYEIDDETLFISYSAAAEHAVHIKLRWPLPRHVIDLRLEYLRVRNGESEDTFDRAGDILSALDYYGLPRMDLSHKEHMRKIAIRGGPFTHQEVKDLLDYCEDDVIAAERLFREMLPAICLPHGLIRGDQPCPGYCRAGWACRSTGSARADQPGPATNYPDISATPRCAMGFFGATREH